MTDMARPPVYTAQVMDVVECTDVGWCVVMLRFESLAAPILFRELYATTFHTDLFRVGHGVSFTLHANAYAVKPSTYRAQIQCVYTLDSALEEGEESDDYPVMPAIGYHLHGEVIWQEEGRLLLDCGLVVEVTPGRGRTLPLCQPGERIVADVDLCIDPFRVAQG